MSLSTVSLHKGPLMWSFAMKCYDDDDNNNDDNENNKEQKTHE